MRSVFGSFLEKTAEWFQCTRGREIFLSASKDLTEFAVADSGFFVYQQQLNQDANRPQIYGRWGDFSSDTGFAYSVFVEYMHTFSPFYGKWVSLDDISLLQELWADKNFSHVGLWPLNSANQRVGLVVVARRENAVYSTSLENAETLMHFCSLQVSNAINAMLTTRRAQITNEELEQQVELRKKMEQELMYESELRLRVIDNIGVGLFLSSLDRVILKANRRVLEMFGYTEDELIDRSVRRIHTDEQSFQTFGHHYRMLARSANGIVNVEHPLRKKDGTEFVAAISGTMLDPHDPTKGILWTIQDISEKLLLENQLKFLARHDALTGLPNRTVLESHLQAAMERARRQNQLFAVGVLDLDNFKPVNDTYGHPAGDDLLMQLTHRLREALRMNDLLVRLGGDEFVLVMEHIQSKSDLEPLMARIQDAIESPILLKHQHNDVMVHMEASLGMVLYPEIVGESDALLREADQVLYQVKSLKGNRKRWWALSSDIDHVYPDIEDIPPYGRRAEQLLAASQPVLQKIRNEWTLLFEEGIIDPSSARESDLAREQATSLHRVLHLAQLFDPLLTEPEHRTLSERLGATLACLGIEKLKAFALYNRLTVHLEEQARHNHLSSDVLRVLMQRLWKDAEGQIAGYHSIDMQRLQVLTDIDSLVWESHKWSDLAESIVKHLARLEEVTSVVMSRPNKEGRFLFEHVAGQELEDYVTELQAGHVPPVHIQSYRKEGLGPTGRAWRYASIQRSMYCFTDETMTAWRDFLIEHQLTSVVAIPLFDPSGHPFAILSLYSHYPGALRSTAQQSMIEHLQKIIGLQLESVWKSGNEHDTVAATHERPVNSTWENRLENHYQPIVELRTGQVAHVHSLPRLRDDNGDLLMPTEFLPLLTEDGRKKLFELGLEEGCKALHELQTGGIHCKLLMNLPQTGLDDRILEAVRVATEQFGILPSQLAFEVLRPAGSGEAERTNSILTSLGHMGVNLIENDLVSGFNNFLLPYDRPSRMIRIDNGLLRELSLDPARMFAHIYNVTSSAQATGLWVVASGLRTWSHVEMAWMLGADFGQGDGIARPMTKEDLVAWVTTRHWQMNATETALGALAGYWRWITDAKSLLVNHHSLVPLFVEEECILGKYIRRNHLQGTALDGIHDQIHETLKNGNTPQFADVQRQLVSIMLERIREEMGLEFQ